MQSRKSFIALSFCVFLIFLAGFFIFYGKEASSSGSWKYVIDHLDEFGYWAIADGAVSQPQSTGNPYYFEDNGIQPAIPYTTAILFGKLSRFMHIKVLTLFPAWHIGMPFLVWLIATGCISFFLKKRPLHAGLIVLACITLTLYVRGGTSFTFFRFSRPMDGLLFVIPWIFCITQRELLSASRNRISLIIPLILIWLHPLYLLPGISVLIIECLHTYFIHDKKHFKNLSWHFISIFAAILIYVLFLHRHIDGQANWMLALLSGAETNAVSHSLTGNTPHNSIHFLSFLITVLTAFFLMRKSGSKFSALPQTERILISLLLADTLIANAGLIVGPHWQLNQHRYYFIFPLLLAETYCLITVFKNLNDKHLRLLTLSCFLLLCLTTGRPHYNMFLAGPLDTPFFYHYDVSYIVINTALLLGFAIGLIRWLNQKIRTKVWVSLGILSLTVLCLTGFALRPSEMHENNREYPYQSAYQWLAAHAAPNEVVLHLSPSRRWNQEYLVFETDLKDYYSPYFGHTFSNNQKNNTYRSIFFNQLLLGWLNRFPIGDISSVDDKLQYLKLNYLLAPKPTPFKQTVELQLGARAKIVFEDSSAILWQITPGSGT